MNKFVNRIIRAARLEPQLYEEVEADKTAMSQAMGVVVLSSIAAGIGNTGRIGLGGIFMGTIAALMSWYIWAFLTYLVGTKLLPEPQTKADIGEMLRTIGFSSSAGLIRIFGFLPAIGPLVFFGSSIWMLIAMAIAVRQALDYKSMGRAVGVCIIGWLIQVAALMLIFSLFFRFSGGPRL